MKEAPDRLKNTEEEPENLKCDEKMEILYSPCFALTQLMVHSKSEDIHQKLELFLLYL